MIIEGILNLLVVVLKAVFGILPDIPQLDGFTSSLDSVLGVIFDNVQLIGCFIRPSTFKLIIPVFLVIYNFEYIYKVTMWILRKIPMIGIE